MPCSLLFFFFMQIFLHGSEIMGVYIFSNNVNAYHFAQYVPGMDRGIEIMLS